MKPEAIEAVLRQLQPYDYGWRCELPTPSTFFGNPVELRIETRPCPATESAPIPNSTEIELVRLILSALPEMLAQAEQYYADYNAGFPELVDKIDQPHIWVCREWLGSEIPANWTFLIGISDAPDWCIHTEFRGLEFREIWSGD